MQASKNGWSFFSPKQSMAFRKKIIFCSLDTKAYLRLMHWGLSLSMALDGTQDRNGCIALAWYGMVDECAFDNGNN